MRCNRVLQAFGAVSIAPYALALPQALGTATSLGTVSTSAPTITLSTVAPWPTAPLTETLPSQAPLPPKQEWCPGEIFCPGPILQTVNIANLFVDPKTFVDKATSRSPENVVDAFTKIVATAGNVTNITFQQIVDFVENNFRAEGIELEALTLPGFQENPAFLEGVTEPLLKAWSQTVHSYWTQLVRGSNASQLCGPGAGDCESTLIPLNHTFVVPGGRFREQYYWDSFWIVEGLLASELYEVVKETLQNFMDELETIGFIPNGGRTYDLNRSQPPLFINMLFNYVNATNDTSILDRALPLAELELWWWHSNRTLNVTSPYTNKTYEVARYAVNNSAPRPESYLTDYLTANGDDLDVPLSEEQKGELYAELATGAETGWDYSVRWFKEPFAGGSNDTDPGLRTLNIRGTIPICLNSILYKAHSLLAKLYSPPFASSSNRTARSLASTHRARAASLRSAILDLFWDPSKLAFYDFNLTSNARNDRMFTIAHFYPPWVGIFPDEVLTNETAAFGMFSTVNMVMRRYNGTYPTTFIESGLQWDAPNAWPPHQYIAIAALRNVPSNVSTNPLPPPPQGQSSFDQIPANQLGIDESLLPGQPLHDGGNATNPGLNALADGTVVNGGNATEGETWAEALQREMVNRYFASAFCSWYATGGEIPGVLPRLSDAELAVTQSQNNTGNMFEKFSNSDIDSAGRGGEYTVQAGFGWTNGVVLWIASNYGNILSTPTCPPLLPANASDGGSGSAV